MIAAEEADGAKSHPARLFASAGRYTIHSVGEETEI
jgi:hypothetical protein